MRLGYFVAVLAAISFVIPGPANGQPGSNCWFAFCWSDGYYDPETSVIYGHSVGESDDWYTQLVVQSSIMNEYGYEYASGLTSSGYGIAEGFVSSSIEDGYWYIGGSHDYWTWNYEYWHDGESWSDWIRANWQIPSHLSIITGLDQTEMTACGDPPSNPPTACGNDLRFRYQVLDQRGWEMAA